MTALHNHQAGCTNYCRLTEELGLDTLVTDSKIIRGGSVVAEMHYELQAFVSVHNSSRILNFFIMYLYVSGQASRSLHI